MTKSQLIAKLVDANTNLLKRDVERIVAVMFDGITDALARGARVELRGFGSFAVRTRGARQGRNPRTGTAVDVEAKNAAYFKAGRDIQERINAAVPEPARKRSNRRRSA